MYVLHTRTYVYIYICHPYHYLEGYFSGTPNLNIQCNNYILLSYLEAGIYLLIKGCPRFMGQYFSGVSIFHGCLYFRGVYISEGDYILGVSIFHGCLYFMGVYISGMSIFRACIYFRGFYILGVSIF